MTLYGYVGKRLLAVVPVVMAVCVIVFLLIRLVPGDVLTMLIETNLVLTEEQIMELKARFGLDRPLYEQFINWLVAASRGDLGYSFRRGTPVLFEIVRTFPVTLQLTLMGFLFSTVVGLACGTLSAIRQNTWIDSTIRIFNVIGFSFPGFWIGILLIMALSNLGIYRIGYVSFLFNPLHNLAVMIPPSVILSLELSPLFSRMQRASLLEVLREDYIRTARGKGLKERFVLLKHALKNSLIPVVTLGGNEFGRLLGGTIIIESVFGIPGMGRLLLTSIYDRDYPLIQGIALIMVLCFVFVNLVVDIMYSYIDPRIRY